MRYRTLVADDEQPARDSYSIDNNSQLLVLKKLISSIS
jgi:hypothetical protein